MFSGDARDALLFTVLLENSSLLTLGLTVQASLPL
jgi:hypothetical protein